MPQKMCIHLEESFLILKKQKVQNKISMKRFFLKVLKELISCNNRVKEMKTFLKRQRGLFRMNKKGTK